MMIPMSDLHRLMSLPVGLFMKSGLWSFSVMNESLGAEASMRSASSSFSAIILSFKVIMSGKKSSKKAVFLQPVNLCKNSIFT